MNVIAVRSDGTWYTRPDTTLEREEKDLYLPDRYESAYVVEGIYVRIVKAGKAIGERFVGRYLDAIYGKTCVVYAQDGMSMMDSSTILMPAQTAMDKETAEAFGRALCDFSCIMSVRIGDILILESSETRILRRGDLISQGILLR